MYDFEKTPFGILNISRITTCIGKTTLERSVSGNDLHGMILGGGS